MIFISHFEPNLGPRIVVFGKLLQLAFQMLLVGEVNIEIRTQIAHKPLETRINVD